MRLKEKMMNSMMEKFLANVSEEEKQRMMSEMMPKMMEECGKKGSMMSVHKHSHKKHHHGNHSEDDCCKENGGKGRGRKEQRLQSSNPMEMCMQMISTMSESTQTAKFATPELRLLFDEWCQQIENEILLHTKTSKRVDPKELSEKYSLTEESIKYILSRMARQGRMDFQTLSQGEN